jgi:hypothetical protein
MLCRGRGHRRINTIVKEMTMSGRLAIACAFGGALSSLGLPGSAKDAPLPHSGPWPIYDWRNHQPTRRQLHAMHMHDLTPNEARCRSFVRPARVKRRENPQAAACSGALMPCLAADD